jgi:hypothetical protein
MQADFRKCLERLDVRAVRAAWAHYFPGLPQPKMDVQVEMVLHYARTAAASIVVAKRVYSHQWLTERSFPSGLPDELRPPEQKSVIVSAVGIAVKARDPRNAERARAVQTAMSNAVLECYDSGVQDPVVITRAMQAARDLVKEW